MKINVAIVAATVAIILFEVSAALFVFCGPQVPGNETSSAEPYVVMQSARAEGREPLDGYGIQKGAMR